MMLSASESMCLEYIQRHEKGEDGVDLNSMIRRIRREFPSMDDSRTVFCAVHDLYSKGIIERRYDGRYEIPEW